MKAGSRSCAALAAVAVLALAVSAVQANSPVFQYSFPASWSGTSIDVIDQSPAAHNGNIDGTLALSASVPPGAAAGTQSITTSAGALVTNDDLLLENSTVAAAGGYVYHTVFRWDGTDSTSWGHVEKIIDYAGTESLQLTTSSGSAQLQLRFDDSVNAVTTTVLPNTWYDVTATFDTLGNAVDSGNLAGMASLVVNGGAPIVGAATKTAQGDGLIRPIGVGELGSHYGYLVTFHGEIYDPSVSLLPEPATLALLGLGGLTMFRRRRA